LPERTRGRKSSNIFFKFPTLDSRGRTIWIAEAHAATKKADEKLTAFSELESVIRGGQRLAAAIG
jgi:hypothetical protein